jgi:hypothetical protein
MSPYAADLKPVLTTAARAQLDACNASWHIRQTLLTEEQWKKLQVRCATWKGLARPSLYA